MSQSAARAALSLGAPEMQILNVYSTKTTNQFNGRQNFIAVCTPVCRTCSNYLVEKKTSSLSME